MNSRDLSSDEKLKAAISASGSIRQAASYSSDWQERLVQFLEKVRASVPEKLDDRAFLEQLWEDQSVSSTGMGSVKVAAALDDPGFRTWFKEQVIGAPKNDAEALELYLTVFYNELVTRLPSFCGRVPRLKLNRVLCALFPSHFTTLADVGKLQVLYRAMSGAKEIHPVRAHRYIRQRLDEVLGAVADNDEAQLIERLCLPWFLYVFVSQESAESGVSEQTPAGGGFKPLPAVLRRKGLTAVRGSFATIMSLVQVLQDGLTREEFADTIRQENPDLAESSTGPIINSVAREFGLCTLDGNVYRLTARGLNLLESQDPDDVADYLLTRVLGVDNVVIALKSCPRRPGG